ncbi:MAG TPA: fumarylacetoacetate hydrolase family protein [Gammaproteobacteria bacterium]|nr:fumarylacetoacetate hydrolase family protein [Gammaproteobacteria bacterium]
MRLLSFAANGKASFGAVVGDGIVDLGARLGRKHETLKALIERAGFAEAERIAADARVDFALADVEFLPTVTNPGKIICIGINYRNRNEEYRDAEAPKYPSVFFRTIESLVGHERPILRPPESEQLDYEGEIVLVIGRAGRRIPEARALEHVAGFTLMNEGSVRDWLRHAKFNVTPGKNFAASGSLGPWMVTADEIRDVGRLHVTTRVNGELRQDDTTENLIFSFARLLAYVSTFMPLAPGDLLATGTPTGAGARFDPPRYLRAGDAVEVAVPGIGALRNRVEDEIVAV